jgi:hypothetical protein
MRKALTFSVRGAVRGTVTSDRRTLEAAVKAMLRDGRECRAQGGGCYSDVRVYCYDPLGNKTYYVPVLTGIGNDGKDWMIDPRCADWAPRDVVDRVK